MVMVQKKTKTQKAQNVNKNCHQEITRFAAADTSQVLKWEGNYCRKHFKERIDLFSICLQRYVFSFVSWDGVNVMNST